MPDGPFAPPVGMLAAMSLSHSSAPLGERLDWYLQDCCKPLSSTMTVILSHHGTEASSRGAGFDVARTAAKSASTITLPRARSDDWTAACGIKRFDADLFQSISFVGVVGRARGPQPITRNAKKSTVAAAITNVASQPHIADLSDRVSVRIARGVRTISIIIAMSGAARTPLMMAVQ